MDNTFQLSSLDDYTDYLRKRLSNNLKAKEAIRLLEEKGENIERVMNDTTLTERDFVEVLAMRRQANYNSSTGNANESAENETDILYSKNPWKFVDEFLQNADDCNYSSLPWIKIRIDETDVTHPFIEFIYNEDGFTRRDVNAITMYSKSAKLNDLVLHQEEEGIFYKEKTGRKGKGFKSVFSMNADNVTAHIRSNGFSFKLDKLIGRIVPIWEDDPDRMDGNTHVIVELKNPRFDDGLDISCIYKEIKRLFCAEHQESIFTSCPLLFMHRIRSVHIVRIKGNEKEEFITEYRENKDTVKYLDAFTPDSDKQILSGIANNGVYYHEQFHEGVLITKYGSETFQVPVIRYTRMVEDKEVYHNYSVVAPIIKEKDSIWKDGALFCTLPMSGHKYHVPVAIDAPYFVNPDRSGIQYSPYQETRDKKIVRTDAPEVNNSVNQILFGENGVLESFFYEIRKIPHIRIDQYVGSDSKILFDDSSNSTNTGVPYIKHIDIVKLVRSYPVFHLFADENNFVSFNDGRKISKDLYEWPHLELFLQALLGEKYRSLIVRDLYAGSTIQNFELSSQKGFSDALNTYIDQLEDRYGNGSELMLNFINDMLYPYLKRTYRSISNNDKNAFRKMKIFFSTLHADGESVIIRENHSPDMIWLHADEKDAPESINRYRIFESSPVNMKTISDITRLWIKDVNVSDYFKNSDVVKKLDDWEKIKDYLEAAYYYGIKVNQTVFPSLKKYVLSDRFEKEENPFRITGAAEVIPDDEVLELAAYFDKGADILSLLQSMGLRKPNDFFTPFGIYLSFDDMTERMLQSENVPQNILLLIKNSAQGKKIRIADSTFSAEFSDTVLLGLLRKNPNLLTVDSYNDLCNSVQNAERLWLQNDKVAKEILIRAIAGAAGGMKSKFERTITLSISDVLSLRLEKQIVEINKNKQSVRVNITPTSLFEKISKEDINTLERQFSIKPNKYSGEIYKGDLRRFGSEIDYLYDDVSQHIYLHCDDNTDYIKSFLSFLNQPFDLETLRLYTEKEQKYKEVYDQIIKPVQNKIGDLQRTYDFIEKNFENYSNQQIISILSWFRSQSYGKAVGNASLNNQREIDDDYRNDPWKFVNEFIQNVDDCEFGQNIPELKIDINTKKSTIVFEYNENGFTLDDIQSLLQFGNSNKINSLDSIKKSEGIFNLEKTGHKGRGFKSVFSLPGDDVIVHICSNGYSFKLTKRLGWIIPIWEDYDQCPSVGSRITVEGFDEKYASKLLNSIKKMLGLRETKDFFAVCPVLFLRKLTSITVLSDHEKYEVKIQTQKTQFSKENVYYKKSPTAGIIHNGEYKESVLENLIISVYNNTNSFTVPALKYSKAFNEGGRNWVGSILAPIINDNKSDFKSGSLYSTLPLNKHRLSIPLSINAPFQLDSDREKLLDTIDNKFISKYVFGQILSEFYNELRVFDDIQINRYIPDEDVLFEDCNYVDEVDLEDKIKSYPILKSFDGSTFVACNNAVTLPKLLYQWVKPDLLMKHFYKKENILVSEEYATMNVAADFLNICKVVTFSKCLNAYLSSLNLKIDEMINLLKVHIYPFIEKNFDRLVQFNRDSLEEMKIFAFTMADGSIVIEDATNHDITWMIHVKNEYKSLWRYRSIDTSPLAELMLNKSWVKSVRKNDIVDFGSAFSNERLALKKINTWEETKSLISTSMYYDVKRNLKVSYLEHCCLSSELDSEENVFRDAYLKTGSERILLHVIDTSDIEHIIAQAQMASDTAFDEVVAFIKSLKIRKGNDFFVDLGSGSYALNDATLALLEDYCLDRETSDVVIATIKNAFKQINSNEKLLLTSAYSKIQKCSSSLFASIFRYQLFDEKRLRAIADDYLDNTADSEDLDSDEALLRALSICKNFSGHYDFSITLSQILKRQLGSCIQECMLNKSSKINLEIDLDLKAEEYHSNDVDKALEWIDDEASKLEKDVFYTADIAAAFDNKKTGKLFILDETKVILNSENPSKSVMDYVHLKYKKDDSYFGELVNIINEQSRLKGPWDKSKKDYIKELATFRKHTWRLKDILLFNDYDKRINEATANSLNYVIPELLQNINDCKPGPDQESRTLNVVIDIDEGTMLLQYDEAGFDNADVYSITALGQSTKHDKSEGEKGLGFKKVFTVFDQVEIYSNDFCFKLIDENNTIPEWIDDADKCEKYSIPGKTSMLFKVSESNKGKLETLLNKWKELVGGHVTGNTLSPLFLNNIDYICVQGTELTYSRKKTMENYYSADVNLLSAVKKLYEDCKTNNSLGLWNSFYKTLETRNKCLVMTEKEREDYLKSLTVTVCIPKKPKSEKNIGCFYSTLPTETKLHAKVFINVPLELTTGRDQVKTDSQYNVAIIRALFRPVGNLKPLFVRLLETIADEHREINMLDYICETKSDLEQLIKDIVSISGIFEAEVNKSLANMTVLKTFDEQSLVACSNAYCVDKMVYRYVNTVEDCYTNIEDWMKTNCDASKRYQLVKVNTMEDYDRLIWFVDTIKSNENHYPMSIQSRDLAVEYLMDEYGYMKEGESDA